MTLDDFPLKAYDKLRYADTDRQGHVNNAVFTTFLETGRVEFLYNKGKPLLTKGASFVIVSLKLDLIAEIFWPGRVDIGTGITRVGNSSIMLFQHLYQQDRHVASAETVIVQIDNQTSNSKPLSKQAKERLAAWVIEK